jgi:hypothetical protein
MKNAVFWDKTSQFVLHRRHITSLLQSSAGQCYVIFEVFTALTMKNAVLWDMKTHFLPHRKHIASPLQSPVGSCYVRFEVFTAVTMKNAVFWDVTMCETCNYRHFGGMYRLHHQCNKNHFPRNNVSSN